MAGGYVDSGDQRDRLAIALVAGENIILQGPAGIGKTRLARELVETKRSESRRVDRLLASESTKAHQFAVLAPLGSPTGVMPGDIPGVDVLVLRPVANGRQIGPTSVGVDRRRAAP